ncbi:SpoIIE family protein phosphatase [Protofrankia symbiont of Coriaria ruscifolia]|uniref:SpoIIE family protein phosphatase n=1 Tax=Protofrankia symbiont of Coriaria ruscifolia TaxID=1306542 RepID=UPI00104161B5|nr:SpoIIE family protein phosphatase [Protofrankia symbiont of Coriaria ruscifolia]
MDIRGTTDVTARIDSFGLPPVASAVLDRRGTVVRWSRVAELMIGYAAGDVLGRPATSLLHRSADAAAVRAEVERCRADGSWGGRLPTVHADGHRVDLHARICPMLDPDNGSSWLVLASDDAQMPWWMADQSMLAGMLAQSPIGMALLDEDLRYMWLNNALARSGGVPRDKRLGRRLSDLLPGLPAERIEERMREVLKTGVPVMNFEYRGRTAADPYREHAYSTSFFRLDDSAGQVLGVCYIVVDVTDRWRAQQRLALLNDASARIGGSLDVMRIAQDLADVAVPRLADFVVVDLLESILWGEEPAQPVTDTSRIRRAGQQSVTPGCPESIAETGDVVQPSFLAARCLIDGKSILEPVLDFATNPWITQDKLRLAKIREFGLRSLMVVPIRTRGVIMGVATFVRQMRPDPFEEDDLLIAEEFVSRAAVWVDNARRYTREHAAALALQRSLLPHSLPGQTAVEVASHYRPADESAGVGGDWFDVIPLSGARVGLVVGDVVGHGLHAAATMGRLRTAVHTLAGLDLPPDELLAHLDDLVIRLADEEEESAAGNVGAAVLGATCIFAVYDPVSRRCTLARAGHPPPAVVSPGGTVDFLDLPGGPPLGLGGLPFESVELELVEGSLLALYTDGLVEGRDSDVDAGLSRLRVALGRADRPLEEIRDRVIQALLPDRPEDDVAFLLARTHALRAERVASWDLPVDPAVVALARAYAARQLVTWGCDEEVLTTELIVSELVTNAIRYATEPIRLRLIRDRTLICEVSDGSSTSPRLRHSRTTDEGGRGLFLVAQFTQRWGARYTPRGKTIWAEQPLRSFGMALPSRDDGWDAPV